MNNMAIALRKMPVPEADLPALRRRIAAGRTATESEAGLILILLHDQTGAHYAPEWCAAPTHPPLFNTTRPTQRLPSPFAPDSPACAPGTGISRPLASWSALCCP